METGIKEFSVPCDVCNDEENHNYGDAIRSWKWRKPHHVSIFVRESCKVAVNATTQTLERKKPVNAPTEAEKQKLLSIFCALIADSYLYHESASSSISLSSCSSVYLLCRLLFGLVNEDTVTAWDIYLRFWDSVAAGFCRLTKICSAKELSKTCYPAVGGMRCRPPLKTSDFKAIWQSCRRVRAKSHKQKCVNRDGCWFRSARRTYFSMCYEHMTSSMAGCVLPSTCFKTKHARQPETEGVWPHRRQWSGKLGCQTYWLSTRLCYLSLSLLKFWSWFDLILICNCTSVMTESGRKKVFKIQCVIMTYLVLSSHTVAHTCTHTHVHTHTHTHTLYAHTLVHRTKLVSGRESWATWKLVGQPHFALSLARRASSLPRVNLSPDKL